MSGGPDLNRRPFPWEGNILPLNYRRKINHKKQTLSLEIIPRPNGLSLANKTKNRQENSTDCVIKRLKAKKQANVQIKAVIF